MAGYDVAVVGLGAMGAAALYHLARRGVRVMGLEQFSPGHDKGSSHGESRAIRLGYSEHPSYVPLVRSAFENWHSLERDTGETVLVNTGILEAGVPGSPMVKGSVDACVEHGLAFEMLDATEVRRRFPGVVLPFDHTAIWQGEGGFLKPERANALHLKLATEAGAEVRTHTKVLALEPGSASVKLRLGDGSVIETGSVIVAAGAWASDLVPELKDLLFIQRMVLCWYETRAPELFGLGTLPVFAIDSGEDIVYGFPDFAGTGFKCASHYGSGVLAHADVARQDAGPDDEARTRRFIERYLPQAAGRLRAMKTCLYTMTKDEDFVIDLLPSDPRIVVASPCSGHGYKFASVIGAVLADLSTTGNTDHDISRFRMARFST
ncbi:N-methyl-L-tryptophan oxidase [Mesorhizobium sp. NBSH29]|uniref:N-methyl-L-tryptophan oxidase n=1 Tax=Mesorhizobium sp. NBSH29 TaxID=2654249 RepID=UPI00189673EE|nr:N-methyl-L-tryptophan oxidase [Mesorhizobium sp. NBSH29]QPC88075.1 N-methyl-L-tryptophan oxidase [Mesorhizobium sp. NBSH29]